MPGLDGGTLLVATTLALIALDLLLRRLPDYFRAGPTRRLLRRWLVPATDLLIALLTLLALASVLVSRDDRTETLLGAALLAGLAWAFRGPAHDFASGVVLRMEGSLEPGEWVGLELASGRIRALGLRTLELETESGGRVRIPYARVAATRIERSAKGGGASAQTFRVSVPRSVPLARVLEELPAHALLSPWSSAARPPEVRLVGETPTDYLLEVTAFAVDPAFVSEIEAAVRLGLSRAGTDRPTR